MSEQRALRKRRRAAQRHPEPAYFDGLLQARLIESDRLLDALPGSKAVHCRKCGASLGVVATRNEYAAMETHDVPYVDESCDVVCVGRSEPVVKTGKGPLIRICRACGHFNRIILGRGN